MYDHLIVPKIVIIAAIRMAAVSVTKWCVTNHPRTSQLPLTLRRSCVGNPGGAGCWFCQPGSLLGLQRWPRSLSRSGWLCAGVRQGQLGRVVSSSSSSLGFFTRDGRVPGVARRQAPMCSASQVSASRWPLPSWWRKQVTQSGPVQGVGKESVFSWQECQHVRLFSIIHHRH